MDDLLVLERVHKKFGNLEILNGVDLTVTSGQRIAVLGPSGAGKSTLLHIAGFMERSTAGRILFQGQDVSGWNERKLASHRLKEIGFLFQFHYLLPDFNVLENTLIPLRLADGDLVAGEQEARNLLQNLGLSHRLNHRPHQLSGGEQQRAALARALINHPRLLLCDEPTGNLDAKTARDMVDLLWHESGERNLTMIIVTHNEELARRVDISYHLKNGRLETN